MMFQCTSNIIVPWMAFWPTYTRMISVQKMLNNGDNLIQVATKNMEKMDSKEYYLKNTHVSLYHMIELNLLYLFL